MSEKTLLLEINRYERGLIINALTELRNTLLSKGEDTYPIDVLLLKLLDAPEKKRFFRSDRLVNAR